MANHWMSFGLVAALAAAGCATTTAAVPLEPEPEGPPLRIEDRSSDAPPPPPGAPPSDAQASAPAPEGPPAPPPSPALAAPAPPSSATPAPPPAPVAPDAPQSTTWTQEYPTGRWVYANGYGWMWVPANAATADNDGVPYSYLYTPTYGWTWYVSPWGPGPYRYGAWVRRPWQPVGWRGAWVARPGIVVHLGGGPRYYHSRDHGGRHRR